MEVCNVNCALNAPKSIRAQRLAALEGKARDMTSQMLQCELTAENMEAIQTFVDCCQQNKVYGKPLVFYGDGGTGKSVLAQHIVNRVGLEKSCYLISEPDVNLNLAGKILFCVYDDNLEDRHITELSKYYNLLIATNHVPGYEANLIQFNHRFV
jgi:DNA replication protein DnaC